MTRVGGFVAESMEHLESEFPDAEVADVILVVSLREVDDDGDGITTVRYACTDDRQYVARGLLEEAVDACRFGQVAD